MRNFLIFCTVLFCNDLYAQVPTADFSATPVSGCSPLIVNFHDLSTGGATSWAWDFGNGNTSTLQNPTASYFTPGNYSVTLTATNANGSHSITRSQYITVNEPPTVDFDANNRNGCFPLRVQFNDLSLAGVGNNNVSWFWDFGNGNTSTAQNPLHNYTTAGNFSVTLRVTNDKGCTRTISRPNYISASTGVLSTFTNTQPTVCSSPATISFTNNSTGPPVLSYLWDFGDGSPTSTALSPTHSYNTNGSFIATLTTTSSMGCTDTVHSLPIVLGGDTTSFQHPDSICVNFPVAFTNTSAPVPASSSWDFGDGSTSTQMNPTHSYTLPGNYAIWLYSNFGSCIDSTMRQITINPAPIANFTAPVTSKCEPNLAVNFQDLSSASTVSWQWDFGDGNTSSLQNPSHIYTSYNSFNVRLIVTNNFGCTDTLVRPGFVNIRRATISINNLPAQGCVPFLISPVPVINAVDAVTSYFWDFGDGNTSTLATPTHVYPNQGNYTVKLVITTSSGCSDSVTIASAVRVGTKSVAALSASPIPVCGRQPVYFTNLTTPASDQWLWDFGDGMTSILQNPSHVYNDTGLFTIRLIATNNGCPDTVSRTNYVRVLPPIARFNSAADCSNRLRFTFRDSSIAPLTWAWDFGDGSPMDNTQNPIHIFPALGTYNVRLIVTNGGCADTIINIIRVINETADFVANQTVACKAATISFNVTTLNPANVASYSWNFGDGGNGVGASVSHTYTNSGTYTVTLDYIDLNGCLSTFMKSNYIRINGPLANFNASNHGGCIGSTTTFNDLTVTDGINSIVHWQWDFGDGIVQDFSAPPFTHRYDSVGTFAVKLVVTDAAGCKDSIKIFNSVIKADLHADFNSADTLTCPGATVNFNNLSMPAAAYNNWSFGDGGVSTASSPSHIYTTSGYYDIRLVIDNGYNCLDSITKTVYINVNNPVADFTMSDSISSCLPLEVTFTNTSTFYNASLWKFGLGQGVSTQNSPVHYYSFPGTYPVTLIVANPGGCVDSIVKNITVFDTVGARVIYLPLDGCKPLNATFNTVSPGPMASYFWDFGDGTTFTSTTSVIAHTYNSYGNFLPKVIMEDPSGCLIPLQGLDTVLVTGANANFGIDNNLFCDIGAVIFSDSTTFNDPVISYQWSFGDGGGSAIQNPSHQYTLPGIYDVQLIVQTQIGCRDTLFKPALIKVVQSPLIVIGGDSVVCVNIPLLHAGVFLRQDTSAVNWQWIFPNGNTSNQQNPTAQIYTTAGTFTVTGIAINSSGCIDSSFKSILVNPLPVITLPGQITVQAGFPVIIPASYSPNATNWLWSPATGLSCTTCPSPTASPKFNTTYQVYVTDVNGCVNTGQIEVLVVCKDGNLFVPNTFSPNGDGSNDIFYPRGKGLFSVKALRIFNRWGEVVFEKTNFPVNDASAGWNGMYRGKRAPADVYVYQLEVFCDNGDIIKLNGNISLIL